MNTQELVHALSSDKIVNDYFLNVYAFDQLPKRKITQTSWILICNCCPAFKPGMHWIVLFKDAQRKECIEIFDSYGQHPDLYNLTSFCRRQGAKHIWYNMRQLQSLTSNVCGHYCLYYAYYRMRGYEMKSIIVSFILHNKFDKNNQLIYEHVIQEDNLNEKYKYIRIN